MSFLSGNIFWHLLWIVPLLLAAAIAGGTRRTRLLRRIFGSDERAAQFSDASRGKRIFRTVLLVFTVLLLIAAAARPSWGKQNIAEGIPGYDGAKVPTNGHDLLVLFDVSKSMLSEDVRPTRLAHAKWFVRKLAERNPGDRFGLIAFAGDAFPACPLTVDKSNFFRCLDDLEPDGIPVGGTNIQIALEEAVKAFAGSPGKHKAIILVTDGEELVGRGASVVDKLKEMQIPVFAVGIGDPANTERIRIPDRDGVPVPLKDRRGNYVVSRLNEKQLNDLAFRTGGSYVRSTASNDGIDEIETCIGKLDSKEGEDDAASYRPLEHPAYPLAAALILLAAFFCIPENRPRRLRSGVLLALFLLFAALPDARAQSAPAARKRSEQAQVEEPRGEKTEEPEPVGEELPRTAVELYNLGLEYQREEHDSENARLCYERAIAAAEKEPHIRAAAYQNLGVIAQLEARSIMEDAEKEFQSDRFAAAEKKLAEASEKYKLAEELYRESMRSAKDASDAVRNQQKLIAERKKADRMIEKIEERKKKQEEMNRLAKQADKQTRDAHERQQRENQRDQQKRQREETQKLLDQAMKKTREARDLQRRENALDRQERQAEAEENRQDRMDEELNRAMDQAMKKTREARDLQRRENALDPQERQAEAEENRHAAQDSMREAGEAVSELEKLASEMDREDREQAAQQAREEIRKAMDEQEQGNGEEAEEHLSNALERLERDRQQADAEDRQDRQQAGAEDRQDRQQAGAEDRQEQRSAQDSAREAEEAVSDLEKQASETNQEDRRQAAQQAREEIQKAMDEQEQGNGEEAEEHLSNALERLEQDRQSEQDRPNGNEQDQQDGGQDRQSAQDMTRQAEQTLSDLEKLASEMNREEQKQLAQQVLDELEKALEEQEQGNGENAEEHLKNAVESLNRSIREMQEDRKRQEQQDGDEQSEQDGNEQDGNEQDGNEQDGDEQEPEDIQFRRDAKERKQDEYFDMEKRQAESILEKMVNEELKFRDVSPMNRAGRRIRQVEKDW